MFSQFPCGQVDDLLVARGFFCLEMSGVNTNVDFPKMNKNVCWVNWRIGRTIAACDQMSDPISFLRFIYRRSRTTATPPAPSQSSGPWIRIALPSWQFGRFLFLLESAFISANFRILNGRPERCGSQWQIRVALLCFKEFKTHLPKWVHAFYCVDNWLLPLGFFNYPFANKQTPSN